MKDPYFVCWIKWDRTNPKWKPIYKFQRCTTEEKAKKFKKELEKTLFIDVWITKLIE